MKIGIFTLPLHTNYGGILQAYALQTVLEREGHHVEVIDVEPPASNRWLMPLHFLKRLLVKIFFRRGYIFAEQRNKEDQKIIRRYTGEFISRYIHQRLFRTLYDITTDDYDAIVVGSDQIWRKPYFLGVISKNVADEFLAFTDGWNLKRLAYAASFGVDYCEYTEAEILEMSKCAKTFDAISVREDSGVKLCKDVLGVEAKHVLDPTMLLDRSDYIKLIETSGIGKSRGDLFAYVLDSTTGKKDLVNRVAADKKLIPFEVHNPKVYDTYSEAEERVQPPVEEWLRAFYDAEFVVTDSFHACAFSIIFGKPFIAVGNAERGMARFQSLLKMFNLESHLLLNINDYCSDADYSVSEDSEQRLVEFREYSMNFIRSSLDFFM
jgi:hypothetical protein